MGEPQQDSHPVTTKNIVLKPPEWEDIVIKSAPNKRTRIAKFFRNLFCWLRCCITFSTTEEIVDDKVVMRSSSSQHLQEKESREDLEEQPSTAQIKQSDPSLSKKTLQEIGMPSSSGVVVAKSKEVITHCIPLNLAEDIGKTRSSLMINTVDPISQSEDVPFSPVSLTDASGSINPSISLTDKSNPSVTSKSKKKYGNILRRLHQPIHSRIQHQRRIKSDLEDRVVIRMSMKVDFDSEGNQVITLQGSPGEGETKRKKRKWLLGK